MSADVEELLRWYSETGHAHVSVLRWYRTVGYARHGGVSVDMDAPCALPGSDIEYLGGTTGRIDGREMTEAEVRTAHKLLAQMWSDARDALQGQSTLVVVQHE